MIPILKWKIANKHNLPIDKDLKTCRREEHGLLGTSIIVAVGGGIIFNEQPRQFSELKRSRK